MRTQIFSKRSLLHIMLLTLSTIFLIKFLKNKKMITFSKMFEFSSKIVFFDKIENFHCVCGKKFEFQEDRLVEI